MACFLPAPSHYLNQCWLLFSEVLWHSPEINFLGSVSDSSLYHYLYNYTFTIIAASPRRKWVNGRCPDSKVIEFNMGPNWGRQDPGGPHVGPMNHAIWVGYFRSPNTSLPLTRISYVYPKCIRRDFTNPEIFTTNSLSPITDLLWQVVKLLTVDSYFWQVFEIETHINDYIR